VFRICRSLEAATFLTSKFMLTHDSLDGTLAHFHFLVTKRQSDKLAPRVIELFNTGNSYRKIASECQLSVNTVRGILRRSERIA
jgi:hypothetical protein